MNPILRNVLAVIAGIVLGSIINMGIIQFGPQIYPMPEGFNFETNPDMSLLKAGNYIMVFLAHALGTLVGALLTARLAASKRIQLALGVGAWFLLGGVAAGLMLKTPMWYNLIDWIFAYVPFAALGGKFGLKKSS